MTPGTPPGCEREGRNAPSHVSLERRYSGAHTETPAGWFLFPSLTLTHLGTREPADFRDASAESAVLLQQGWK